MTAPLLSLEQRILTAAADSDANLDVLLDEAERSLPNELYGLLLDKVWLILYEQCLEITPVLQED